MRRMIVAVVIVLVIALLSFWEQSCIDSVCKNMEIKIEKTGELVEKGDYINAYRHTDETKKFWDEKENIMDVIIRHDDTDDITLDIEVLKRYILLEEKSLSLALVDEITGQFREIREKTKIHYKNIF